MGHDPGRIATSVYLAICRFVSGRTNTKAVQEIRMVIFQAAMLNPVINGFKASLQGKLTVFNWQTYFTIVQQSMFGKKLTKGEIGHDEQFLIMPQIYSIILS